MTYCVGLMLDAGIMFMSDTRTNAGLDNISSFGKTAIWDEPGDRCLTLMAAGNLATTQAVVSLLNERSKSHDDRKPEIFEVPSMFQAATLIADTLREVIANQRGTGPSGSDSAFRATLILGGQIAGGPPRMFMIYPEGNFIEAGADTPYFQIGETKYGRPILVRAYDRTMGFEEAMKLLLVSFDSTLKANLSVGMPLDYHFYETDSLCKGTVGRIEADNAYFDTISTGWGDALKTALDSLPAYKDA